MPLDVCMQSIQGYLRREARSPVRLEVSLGSDILYVALHVSALR